MLLVSESPVKLTQVWKCSKLPFDASLTPESKDEHHALLPVLIHGGGVVCVPAADVEGNFTSLLLSHGLKKVANVQRDTEITCSIQMFAWPPSW